MLASFAGLLDGKRQAWVPGDEIVNWKDTAELIGIVAIVASLVFVGLQMKQSQEIAIATQYQERTAITIETMSVRSQMPDIVESIGAQLYEEFQPYVLEQLSTTEIGQKWFAARLSLASFDNVHFQWQAGYLSDEGWDMQRRTLRHFLNTEPMGRFIIEQRDLYRESFATLCKELVSK